MGMPCNLMAQTPKIVVKKQTHQLHFEFVIKDFGISFQLKQPTKWLIYHYS